MYGGVVHFVLEIQTTLTCLRKTICQSLVFNAEIKYLKVEYDAARQYYEEAVRLAPDNALYLGNLGNFLLHMADYKKSIEYSERALAINKRNLGEEHPEVAANLNNIGSAWKALGEYKKAIGYYEKALKIFEDKVGADHPYTKTVKGNMEYAKSMLQMQK